MSSNQLAGRRAYAVGRQFEAAILDAADYEARLYVIKQHTPAEFLGKHWVVTGTAEPDFIAVLDARWIFIFDAKSTGNKNRLSLQRARTARGKDHDLEQFLKLRHAASRGLTAFYLVAWQAAEEAEAFTVNEESNWPFVAVRGQGAFSRTTRQCSPSDNWLLDVLVAMRGAR